jgi:hypothetical protein
MERREDPPKGEQLPNYAQKAAAKRRTTRKYKDKAKKQGKIACLNSSPQRSTEDSGDVPSSPLYSKSRRTAKDIVDNDPNFQLSTSREFKFDNEIFDRDNMGELLDSSSQSKDAGREARARRKRKETPYPYARPVRQTPIYPPNFRS